MNGRACTPPILSVEGLSVAFDTLKALEAVSLALAPGERLALLGHNGAGKSTLFKAVLGFLRPAAGRIGIAGAKPGSRAARQAVSYLPESVAFPKTLTGAEVIGYFARLKSEDPRAALSLLETVGIADAAGRRVATYSKGMRQRLGLAQALIGRPRLLLLDEPTSGLDPVSRREFYEIIDRVAGEGAAVLLSSHSLTEVEAQTDRIAILSRGRLVAEGPLADLARQAQLPVVIRVEADEGAVGALHEAVGGRRVNGRSVVLSCRPSEKVGVLARIAALRPAVTDINVAMPQLEDVYRHFGGQQGDAS